MFVNKTLTRLLRAIQRAWTTYFLAFFHIFCISHPFVWRRYAFDLRRVKIRRHKHHLIVRNSASRILQIHLGSTAPHCFIPILAIWRTPTFIRAILSQSKTFAIQCLAFQGIAVAFVNDLFDGLGLLVLIGLGSLRGLRRNLCRWWI